MRTNAIYKVSDDPPIYVGFGSKNWDKLSGAPGKKAYMLSHIMWHFNWKSIFIYWKFKIDLKKRNVDLLLLHNTSFEKMISWLGGLGGYFINQNIHVSEHIFKPVPGIKKMYDAVYIAAAKKYKRLSLANKIKSLFIITYFWPEVKNERGEWDLHGFEPGIKHADFNRFRIDAEEINKIINTAYCGLALSKKEGAMLASMEYQLAGLPVVTTPSKGGRDILLDPVHTKWVKDNPDEIAKAVEHFKKSAPDPYDIRNRTLDNLTNHRRRFYSLVSKIYLKHNKQIDHFDDFQKRIWGTGNGIENNRVF